MLIMWVRCFFIGDGGVKKRISLVLIFCLVMTMICGCSEIPDTQVKTATEIETVEETTETEDSLVEGMELYPIYKDIKVHFIDVGQGDCEFIELPNGQTMLIDAGNEHNGSEIISYIKSVFEYDKIDFVVATHPHSDHIGGMAEVISHFDVGAMYMPEKAHTTDTFKNLLEAIENNSIELHRAKADVNILTSGLLRIDLLAPFDEQYSNLNNYSAVVKITYDETVLLFMGDAESQVEYKLLDKDIDADVLKVGHHGSDTSSTELFISEVSPSVAVISSGGGYGHPHSTTLAILNDYKADIYRTDEVGTIVVTADGHKKVSVNKKASTIKENAPPEKVEEAYVAITDNERTGVQVNTNILIEVYKTKSGECYHHAGCSSLSKSKMPTTVESAKNVGLRPCKRCNPPG